MVSRTFRLAAVLRVRGIQERQAKGEVGLAQRALLTAQQEAARRLAAARNYQISPSTSVEQFQAQVAHGGRLSTTVAAAEALADEAAGVVTQRRLDWQQAKQQVKPIERLAEHHQEAVHNASVKADQNATDEVASSRWRRPH